MQLGKNFKKIRIKGKNGWQEGKREGGKEGFLVFNSLERLLASAPLTPQPSNLRRKPPPRACVASNLLQVFWWLLQGPFPSRPPSLGEIDSRVEEAFPGTAFLMVISPQHHLPAAAAPAPCAAHRPRGPETGRRAGSRLASDPGQLTRRRGGGRGVPGRVQVWGERTGGRGPTPPPTCSSACAAGPYPEIEWRDRSWGRGGPSAPRIGGDKQTCFASIN